MAAAILLCLAFALACAITVMLERRSAGLGLIQRPNSRSAHINPTPTGGGASIAVMGTLGFMLAAFQGDLKYAGAAAIAAILAILGFIDDRADLSPAVRFPLQAVLIGGLVALAFPLPSLAIGSMEISGLPLAALLVLIGLWWINLFNFMDGIDGIAATQAILILGGSAAISLTDGQAPLLISGVIIAAAGGFLTRNWPPARIFMGDVGSNFLAFAILAVALFSIGKTSSTAYPTWIILTAIFVADASATLLRRVWRGERPWEAHNSHAYQRLSRKFGHLKITLLYSAITVFWSLPIAIMAHHFSAVAWELVVVTYTPLLAFSVVAGAGNS